MPRRLLRIDLHGCTPNDVLLDWVSDCKFDTRGQAAGSITKDRSSFGKDIEQSVASGSDEECPEEIVLTVPIFTDPCLKEKRRIVCAVEVHTNSQMFELLPFPGELDMAINVELACIEGLMTGDDGVSCPVFRGCL